MMPPMHDPIILRQPKMVKDVHTVQAGDTMNGIAIRYGVTSQAIMTENGLASTTIIIGQKLTIPNPHIVKDGRGFPVMNESSILARVVEESTLVLDTQGQEKQATRTVMMPPTVHPSLGDEVQVEGETLTIMKVKARKSYSGKKIYYWVTNCGE